MLVALALWIACIYACDKLGERRGERIKGDVLGLLLGPVGLLIMIILPVNEEKAAASGTMKKCPYCAEMIKREARICHHCGHEVPVNFTIKKML